MNDKAEKQYTVSSDRLVGHERGDVVTADDLGATVDSLLASGHIKPKRATKPKGDA